MYQRHGMPRAYYSSSQYSPSPNQVAYNLPTANQSRDQSLHKMTVEFTTKRPPNSPPPPNKPEKLQSPPSQFAANFQLFDAIQISKDKFHIRQVYPIEPNLNRNAMISASNADGFVTAMSVTSADNPVSIPALQQTQSTIGGATLILEPSSSAIVGNGGVAISSPVSRAILRKNMGTRVLYRPQSVAVAGVGGTAHAQSDLILDYVE